MLVNLRALLCCSDAHSFVSAVTSVSSNLQNAGYPARPLPGYDAGRRAALLAKLRNRAPTGAGTNTGGNRHLITLVLPFNEQLLNLKLQTLWLECIASVIPINFRLAWSVQPNSLRKLYRLNWVVHNRVLDSMGNG